MNIQSIVVQVNQTEDDLFFPRLRMTSSLVCLAFLIVVSSKNIVLHDPSTVPKWKVPTFTIQFHENESFKSYDNLLYYLVMNLSEMQKIKHLVS